MGRIFDYHMTNCVEDAGAVGKMSIFPFRVQNSVDVVKIGFKSGCAVVFGLIFGKVHIVFAFAIDYAIYAGFFIGINTDGYKRGRGDGGEIFKEFV